MEREGFSPRSLSPAPEPNVNRSGRQSLLATASCPAGGCSEPSGHGPAMIQQGGGSLPVGRHTSCELSHTASGDGAKRETELALSVMAAFTKMPNLDLIQGEGGEGERRMCFHQ